MITTVEIRGKGLKTWQSGRFLTAWLKQEELFPLDVGFRKVTGGKEALESFAQVRTWLSNLREGSKDGRGYGYRVEFTAINHRQLGIQQFPNRIYFESATDFLRFIGKQKDFELFQALADQTLEELPELREWLEYKPLKVLEYQGVWSRMLSVCRFLKKNHLPHRYIRELDIPGVDSKFIEQNKSILRELLDIILPADAIHCEVTLISGHGFERRFGFRYDEPLIRFRLLDVDLTTKWGLTDISVPLGQFHSLAIPCDTIIITENKINGLSFPPQRGAAVIFGLGYGISSLRDVEWLGTKRLLYWGDIDTHGFSILSQVRGYFPQTESFLMDLETLEEFRLLWVTVNQAPSIPLLIFPLC